MRALDSSLLTEAAVAIDKGYLDALAESPADQDLINLLCRPINTGTRKVKSIINGLPAKWREWLGERVYHDLSRYAFSFENKTYEVSHAVDVDDLDDDLYGFGDIGRMMAIEGQWWERDLLIAAVQAGPTTTTDLDGQYFFDTDHPIDPANSGSSTYSNYSASGMALTGANLATVITTMRRYKTPTGRVLRVRPKTVLVPPQLEFTAKALLDPTLVLATTGNAGIENIYRGIVNYQVVEEFENEPTAWYVVGDVRGALQPFILSRRLPVRIDVLNANTDAPVFEHNEIRFGGKARGAAVPALPFLIYKAVA